MILHKLIKLINGILKMSSVGQKRGRNTAAQKRAYWANSKFSGVHPWSTWGAARIERGSPWSLQNFGATARSADSTQKANRQMTGYTGKGLYSGRGKFRIGHALKKHHIGKKLVHAAKRAHLGQLGIDALTVVNPEAGAMAQAANTAYRGKGLYSGRGTYSMNSLVEGGRPSMQFSGGGDNQDLIITHCEYLQDVYGPSSGAFQNNSLALNPGMMQNFPWLSQIAANYEEYELQQMVFEFHSTVDASATNNTSGATGTVIMATNYNPDAAAFRTKEVMMQYHGANSGRVTEDMVHGTECDPSKMAGTATKFIRTTTPANQQSLKDFDYGTFQWALVNIPAGFENQQVGELWCYYTVKLSKPRLFTSVFRNLPYDVFASNSSDSTISVANCFGDDYYLGGRNSLNCQIDTIGGTSDTLAVNVTFPDHMTGFFEITWKLNGTVMDIGGNPTITFTGGASALSIYPQQNANGFVSAWHIRQGNQGAVTQAVQIVPTTSASGGGAPVDSKVSIRLPLPFVGATVAGATLTITPVQSDYQELVNQQGVIINS